LNSLAKFIQAVTVVGVVAVALRLAAAGLLPVWGGRAAAVFLADDDRMKPTMRDDRPLRDTATDALVVAAVEEPLGLKKS
jgi:hypothetical protein